MIKKSTHLEEDGIVLEELWQIGIPERTQKYDIFVLVGVLAFERASHDEHRLESTHTKVIMILLRQLLRAQLVHLCHLLCKVL